MYSVYIVIVNSEKSGGFKNKTVMNANLNGHIVIRSKNDIILCSKTIVKLFLIRFSEH